MLFQVVGQHMVHAALVNGHVKAAARIGDSGSVVIVLGFDLQPRARWR